MRGSFLLGGALRGNRFLTGCLAWETFSYGVPGVGIIFLSEIIVWGALRENHFSWGALNGSHFLMECLRGSFLLGGALHGNRFLMVCLAWETSSYGVPGVGIIV